MTKNPFYLCLDMKDRYLGLPASLTHTLSVPVLLGELILFEKGGECVMKHEGQRLVCGDQTSSGVNAARVLRGARVRTQLIFNTERKDKALLKQI